MYNNFFIAKSDSELSKDSDSYYEKLLEQNLFYLKKIPPMIEIPQIDDNAVKLLSDILRIFKKHNTSYKLVISPLYNTPKFNSKDFQTLVSIFGSENVFDFSGNNQITTNHRNYYERSHYRPEVGKEIFQIIYSKDAKSKIDQLAKN
jgi:hypothetical protein